jgi:hypothetical protein
VLLLRRSSAGADGASIFEEQNFLARLLLLVRGVVGSSAETPVSMGKAAVCRARRKVERARRD